MALKTSVRAMNLVLTATLTRIRCAAWMQGAWTGAEKDWRLAPYEGQLGNGLPWKLGAQYAR